MILEGLVTTTNSDGSTNVAPMGPKVDAAMTHLLLRPFKTSKTFENLNREREGVFHVVDDVELLAKAAIGQLENPAFLPSNKILKTEILANACRWYAFHILSVDDSHARAEMQAKVFRRETLKEFFGFNRAKHAVLEAAILATRIGVLPKDEIEVALPKLAQWVNKTGGTKEHRAFDLLETFIFRKRDAHNGS